MNRFSLFVLHALLLVGVLAAPLTGVAQQSLSLSVTPPLVQLSIGPTENWQSFLKVVNSNQYDLTVYASVVDFAAEGESGQGRFLPLDTASIERGEKVTLGSWVTVPVGPIFVPREQSAEIPITVSVPEGASPGGHYAAILIGTSPSVGAPPPGSSGNNQTKVSSFVTTLLFVRIGGEVIEQADIREFTSLQSFYQKPEVSFSLKFENKGNVHVLPQGTILIKNMWGKVRGEIPVNQKTDFGNVLPAQVRKYDFSWKGEASIFEAGRYKAEATLTYGSVGRKTVSSVSYFYVLPLIPVGSLLLGFTLVVLFIVFSVRRYVRRAIALEREMRGGAKIPTASSSTSLPVASSKALSMKVLARPLVDGVMDLRSGRRQGSVRRVSVWKRYRSFMLFVIAVVVVVGVILFYFSSVLLGSRKYEIAVSRGDTNVSLSSEEVAYESLRAQTSRSDEDAPYSTSTISIHVKNVSTHVGSAASVAVSLERLGFKNITVSSGAVEGGDNALSYKHTFEREAFSIAQNMGILNVSLSDEGDTDIHVTIRKPIQ